MSRRFRAVAVTSMLALCMSLAGVASAAPKKKKKPRAAAPTAVEPAATKTEAEPAKPEPAAVPEAEPAAAKTEAAAAVEVELPLEVKGKLSKDSRRKLADRLKAAAAAAKPSGPYRARMAVRLSNKRDYGLTLTLLGADGTAAAAASDECKACSLDQVGARIDALMDQAVAGLAKDEAPGVGSVSVSSTPLGARILVDGVERGLTPQVLELSPGEHAVLIDKPGFAVREQSVTVEAGGEQKLELELSAQPNAAPVSTNAGRGLKIGGAVVLGLGLAGIGTGVAMILIDEDPMPQRCSGADVDFRGVCRYRYDTLLGGIVGVGLGAVGVAGGLAMMIKGHQIAVRARAGKQQASLGLVWRW